MTRTLFVIFCVITVFTHAAFAAPSADVGVRYNAEWKRQNPTPYTGVGVTGRAAGDEHSPDAYVMFGNITRRAASSTYVRTGREFFNFMTDMSYRQGCIPKLTWASHGWNPKTLAGGDGLPTDVNDNGFYFDTTNRGPHAVSMKDFYKEVSRGRIRFCSTCLIQIHACNVSLRFTSELSRISGCQLINGSGRVSPVNTNDGSKDHVWTSTPIPGSLCRLPDGTECGGDFIRLTPTRKGTLFEKIGKRYVAE